MLKDNTSALILRACASWEARSNTAATIVPTLTMSRKLKFNVIANMLRAYSTELEGATGH